MDALHLSAPACNGTKPNPDAHGVANSYSHKHAHTNRDLQPVVNAHSVADSYSHKHANAHRDPRPVVNAFSYTRRSYGYCS